MKKIEKINRNQKKYGLSLNRTRSGRGLALNRTRSGRGLALNRTRSGSGFTIIELMVVVLIIAILASIVIVTLEKGKLKARDSQRKADLASIATSLENYRVDKKSYPESPGHAFCNIGEKDCLDSVEFNKYQLSMPKDPINETPYVYRYMSNGKEFKIITQSEGITDNSTGDCTKGERKQKSGDFCDPAWFIRLQVSSSPTALMW